ncbi:hypothetical protein AJ78_08579 [Emergomyces pasteurianus Ep9510]|uniref:C2H2-type domain-containing protein n=1 Tax=Emergomyces pasteurianus Ep9510 TaxID=1447872 RepID=A0A1J9Q293_9EURO|nr:hypothetical protein AJ78_08579 [Emergomyces pasteurianus Ep9510]
MLKALFPFTSAGILQDISPAQHSQNIDYALTATPDARELEAVGGSHQNLLLPTAKLEKSPNNADDSPQQAAERERISVLCAEQGCGRTFSDRACLLRHRREVHKISSRFKTPGTYSCPVPKCPRHTKPFARLWNLQNHLKIHGKSGERLREQLITLSSDYVNRHKPRLNDDELSDIGSSIVDISAARQPLQSLQTKLSCLLEERRELDEKIRALRNARRIMEDMN